jgi:hypothetical protein
MNNENNSEKAVDNGIDIFFDLNASCCATDSVTKLEVSEEVDLSQISSGLYAEIFDKIDSKYAALQEKYKDISSLDDNDVGLLTDLSFSKLLILSDVPDFINNEILKIVPVGNESSFHAAKKKHARINMFVDMFKGFVDSDDGKFIPSKNRAYLNLAFDTLSLCFEEIQIYQQAYLEDSQKLKTIEYDRVRLITQTHMDAYVDLLLELKYLVKNAYNLLLDDSPEELNFYNFDISLYADIV